MTEKTKNLIPVRCNGHVGKPEGCTREAGHPDDGCHHSQAAEEVWRLHDQAAVGNHHSGPVKPLEKSYLEDVVIRQTNAKAYELVRRGDSKEQVDGLREDMRNRYQMTIRSQNEQRQVSIELRERVREIEKRIDSAAIVFETACESYDTWADGRVGAHASPPECPPLWARSISKILRGET